MEKKITVVTHYQFGTGAKCKKIALVSDLHDRKADDVVNLVNEEQPDFVAITGDLFEFKYIRRDVSSINGASNSLAFLSAISQIAPVFFSEGNHDVGMTSRQKEAIAKTGTIYLKNSDCSFEDIYIGGLAETPNLNWLKQFSQKSGPKLLLCHRPEYWKRYVRQLPIDLTLAGHAHGGQWRIGNQGVYAPGQGLMPQLTRGIYERKHVWSTLMRAQVTNSHRELMTIDACAGQQFSSGIVDNYQQLIVSAGLANTCGIPRINNPLELVVIQWHYGI